MGSPVGEPVTTASSSGLPRTTSACCGERPDDRRGLGVAPQPTTEVDVEADRQARAPGQLDRLADRIVGRGGERRRDPGDVQPASAGEEAVGRRPVHVHHREPRAGRAGPSVDDLRRPEDAPLAQHQAGRRLVVDDEVADIHALAAQLPDDRGAEPVTADPADVRDRVAEPRQPDRDVRLGAGDVALERGRLGERAGCRGDQRDQALAERDDVGGHQRRASRADATASTTWRARRVTPFATPSPTSQLPRPTATAPAAMNDPAVSAVTPPVGMSGMSGNGPQALPDERRPERRGGEELHRGRAGPPRGEDLGRGGGARECRDAPRGRPADQLGVGRRHHEEGRTGVHGEPGVLDAQHGPGADRDTRAGAGDGLDGPERDGLRLVEGDLERVDATLRPRASATAGAVSAESRRAMATTPPARRPRGDLGSGGLGRHPDSVASGRGDGACAIRRAA